MQKIEYVGEITPSRDVEKEAFAYIGLSKIPELRGTEFKITLSKSDTNLYYARLESPGRKFAGEIYFPMSSMQSYVRVIGEGMMQFGSMKTVVVPRMQKIVDDTSGTMQIDASCTLAPFSEIWKAASSSSPPQTRLIRNGIEFRLFLDDGSQSALPEELMEDARKKFALDRHQKALLNDALVNIGNFEFYISGKKEE